MLQKVKYVKVPGRPELRFTHFGKICEVVGEDLMPKMDADAAIRFIPTDTALLAYMNYLNLSMDSDEDLILLYDMVQLTQVDMRDLRNDESTNSVRVTLDNFKSDIGSFDVEYLALWHLEQSGSGSWTIDDIEIIDTRVMIKHNNKVLFVWGINGVLLTPVVSERLEKLSSIQ